MARVLVIGGGPAGMMSAISTKIHFPHSEVLLFERNFSLGRKLLMSGGGRCNVTAAVSNEHVIKQVFDNGKFLYSALNQFDTQAIMDFFEAGGCPLKVEDHSRVFPLSNKAQDVLEVLINQLHHHQVKLHLSECVTKLDLDYKILTTNLNTYTFDHVIMASGGLSFPKSGSDGSGFELLSHSKHQLKPLRPAETPLISQDPIIQSKALMGLSLKDVKLSLFVNHKKRVTLIHDVIFTHFGLSGPGAFSISSYIGDAFDKQQEVTLMMDFSQHLEINGKDEVITSSLPKRFVKTLETMYPDLPLAQVLKSLSLRIHDVKGFNSAFVSSGGIKLKGVDPKNFKSKYYPHLSLCGEMLDLSGHTGGYNMTIAFVSGYVAGKHALA